MAFSSVPLLAVGLAMDAAAVSATRGLAVPKVEPRHALSVALFFGGAQAGMPLLGWLAGDKLGTFAAAWGDWIAAAVFFVLGGKMLIEVLRKRAREGDAEAVEEMPAHPFAIGTMALLALATSIDALVAGVTLPMLHAPLVASVATIGGTTAALSVLALYGGRRLGRSFEGRLDLIGGILLVGLGAKVVVAHLLV